MCAKEHLKIILSKQLNKNIAWNGISLDLPMAWDFVNLGYDHLLMGENNEPVFEISWTRKPLRGSLETQMERFSSRVQKRLGITVHPLSAPLTWAKSDLKMTIAGFSWESVSSRGKGLLISCNSCQRISMLRFFAHSKTITDSLMESVVRSYHDSCGRKGIDWKLFGLNLSTPEGFRLLNYSFRPGSFMMAFKAKGQGLTVYSWGPASFLLLKDELEDFARKRVSLPDLMPMSEECNGGDSLVWEWRGFPWPLGFWQRNERFRIFHDKGIDRIIGLKSISNTRDGWKIMEGSIN